MSTWKDVQEYVHKTYKVEDVNEGLMKLTFNMGDGRSQVGFVEHAFNDKADWIKVHSPIGPVDTVNLKSAAKIASDKIVGGIIVMSDMVYLSNAMPLENLDTNELEEPLHRILSIADEMERNLVGGDDY
jgi:hypothetical protein